MTEAPPCRKWTRIRAYRCQECASRGRTIFAGIYFYHSEVADDADYSCQICNGLGAIRKFCYRCRTRRRRNEDAAAAAESLDDDDDDAAALVST